MNKYLVSFGLGIVSAVVFTSSTTGAILFRYLFFLVTSLPIFLSGLGWGWQSAFLSGLSCVLILSLVLGLEPALICAAGQIIPAIILCYLGLQSQSYYCEENKQDLIEWYPVGRLLLWAALIAGTFSFSLFLLTNPDMEALRSNFKEYITKSLNNSVTSVEIQSVISERDVSALTDLAIRIIPAAVSISWFCALIFNLWLSARIALTTGQLKRPWPDLSNLNYPSGTTLMFFAAILASNANGIASLIGISFMGSLFVLYVFCGLAVIHKISRITKWRPFILWVLYICLFLVNFWVALLVAIIGLLDGPLKLRERFFYSEHPPPSSTNA